MAKNTQANSNPTEQTDSADSKDEAHVANDIKKRRAASPAGAPGGKRRARPPNIKITSATATNSEGQDEDDSTSEVRTKFIRRTTRSMTRLRNLTINTPVSAIGALAITTPVQSTPKPKEPFRMLAALIAHPEICLRFATLLDPSSLTDLYSISRPFHFIMNSHFTTYIRQSAHIHAPDSGYIFPWRCYRRLTIKDPGFRLNSVEVARDVPSLRWLQMVTNRHRAVVTIVEKMKERGHVFVGRDVDIHRALKKMWFTMDLPRNGARIGVIHNTDYWSDQDIFMATFFCIKLDMRFTCPFEGTGEVGLRKLMLGQRGLYPLRDLLLGKLDKIDLLAKWVAYDYTPRPENRNLPAIGIAPQDIGRGCLEGWGSGQIRLLRPDELLVRENVRRSMNLHMRYLDIIRFGYMMQSNDKTRPKSGKTTFENGTRLKGFVDTQMAVVKAEWKEREEMVEAAKVRMAIEARKNEGKPCVWLLGKKKGATGI